jgi:tetratricopeptide (TPR) repeat protein
MLQHRIICAIGLMLWCSMIWMATQGFIAEAQVLPEATIYVDRAVIAYEEKRYDEALQELQEAFRLDPENVDALYYQGLVHVALNRIDEAQAAWEKARALRPSDLDVAFQLGPSISARSSMSRPSLCCGRSIELSPVVQTSAITWASSTIGRRTTAGRSNYYGLTSPAMRISPSWRDFTPAWRRAP